LRYRWLIMLSLGTHRFRVRTATFRHVHYADQPVGWDFNIRTDGPVDPCSDEGEQSDHQTGDSRQFIEM